MDLVVEDCSSWCKRMMELLVMERDEEVAATEAELGHKNSRVLEQRGVRLRSVAVEDVEVGLGGRALVTLVPRGNDSAALLPSHRMGVGDTVLLTPVGGDESEGVRGVVTCARKSSLTVAIQKDETVDRKHLQRVDLLADEVSFRRMAAAVEQLQADQAHPLKRILFDAAFLPQFGDRVPWTPIDGGLNQSQRDAIGLCLQARHLSVIHGPPGTGKTTTVAELIKQLLLRGLRVLAVAPSNVAVDNLLEKVASFEPQLYRPLRLGHPARLLPTVLPFAIENVIARSMNASLCDDIRVEMRKIAQRQTDCKDRGERKTLQFEFRTLRKELREKEKKAVGEVLGASRVVFATLTGCADRMLRHLEEPFDVVVIDEAAQALEPACWIAMLRARRVVLAGDHMQLPPTITSVKAQERGLGVTLLDRAVRRFGVLATRMLDTQYRMHETIMGFSARELYEGKLKAYASVAAHLLTELPSVAPSEEEDEDEEDVAACPLVFFDTAGCGLQESQDEDTSSRDNAGEAALVAQHVQMLLERGLPQNQVAVITPYNAQVQLIRALLGERFPGVEVGSVDGFQGREKEAIVMSLVRSNKKGQVGFLADFRRMNVAVTRARRHCCVFGDSQTICSNPFLAKLVAYFEEHAEYRSVQTGETAEAPRFVAPSIVVAAAPKSPPRPPRLDVNAFAQEMATLLDSFWASAERSRLLDAKYNAAQRRLVHEAAETMSARGQSIYHRSAGSGEERIICISKDPFPVAEIECVEVRVTAPPIVVVVVAEKEPIVVAQVEATALVEKKSAKVPKVELKKKKKKKKQEAIEVVDPTQATPDDRLLDEAIAERKHGLCHYEGCKVITSLVMVYTTCRHCANAFCTSHSLPEIHGCGDAAKKAARKEWLAKSQQAQNAAAAPPPISKAKKEVLKNVLHKKLKEAQQSRAPKKKK